MHDRHFDGQHDKTSVYFHAGVDEEKLDQMKPKARIAFEAANREAIGCVPPAQRDRRGPAAAEDTGDYLLRGPEIKGMTPA